MNSLKELFSDKTGNFSAKRVVGTISIITGIFFIGFFTAAVSVLLFIIAGRKRSSQGSGQTAIDINNSRIRSGNDRLREFNNRARIRNLRERETIRRSRENIKLKREIHKRERERARSDRSIIDSTRKAVSRIISNAQNRNKKD